MNDLLLSADIARACGRRTEYAALGVLIRRRFPCETQARMEYALSLAGRPAAMSAIRELTALTETCEAVHMPRVQAMLAAAFARAGFRATARRHAAIAEGAGGARDPFACYDLAWTAMYLTDWNAAIEHGERAVKLAPLWPQACGTLASAHLAVGHATEAGALLRGALDNGIEDEAIDLTVALFEFSQNRLDAAAAHFERYRTRWAGARSFRPAMVTAAIVRWSLGQPDAARDAALASGSGLSELLDGARPDGQHCFIPVGYIAQRHNQCVPTSIAMIARAQGMALDADDLFGRMQGSDGTALWRMRHVMEKSGFNVLCLRAEPGILRHMLDLGLPLMGCTETRHSAARSSRSWDPTPPGGPPFRRSGSPTMQPGCSISSAPAGQAPGRPPRHWRPPSPTARPPRFSATVSPTVSSSALPVTARSCDLTRSTRRILRFFAGRPCSSSVTAKRPRKCGEWPTKRSDIRSIAIWQRSKRSRPTVRRSTTGP
ncbi:MAG: hypothetical protein BWK77_07640 [Verrucomicrobia bacterium A1]|nr:MAG: hypothetical protein BWK77_07640 [Verrucomicrobia bacterium A1]